MCFKKLILHEKTSQMKLFEHTSVKSSPHCVKSWTGNLEVWKKESKTHDGIKSELMFEV